MSKRLLDLVASLLGLVLLSPFFLIVSLMIKARSSDAVFSRQERVGKGFRSFSLYRFRTRFSGADSRFLPLGKFLCAFKLSGLPQLINVLRGEMSLVGPPPALPALAASFRKDYEIILQVLPGIMCLAPTPAARLLEGLHLPPEKDGKSPLPEEIMLAKAYVQERSFRLDLKIIVATLLSTFLSLPLSQGENGGPKKKQVKEMITDARAAIIFLAHSIAIVFSNYAAFWLRFDGEIPEEMRTLFLKSISLVLLARLAGLYTFGLNRGLWRYAGLRDLITLVWSVVASSLLVWGGITLLSWEGYPRSIYLIDAFLLLFILSALRSARRVCNMMTQTDVGGRRVLIVGAGNAGEMIARDMKRDRRYPRYPVAFVDDDPQKQSRKIHNIPVKGTTEEIQCVVSEVHPDEILIAIPSASPKETKRIIQRCKSLKLPIKTLPNIAACLGGTVSLGDIKSIDIEDLLGRTEIQINDPAVSEKIRQKRILVTGAGGSIGSELCRQIAGFEPEQLILIERHENSLYQIELDLREHFPDLPLEGVLADVCDTDKLGSIFSAFRPQMVFHAAAFKHVPMMERSPLAAVRNNILGTYGVIINADLYGVEEFVLISTDKAVSPSSVMGATKRVAEMMVRFFDGRSRTKLVSVRFGNVLESAGSVVPLFRDQIRTGGPVKVTHPEVRRYFISIREAVQLVLQASLLGSGGEVFVLDMGEPVKVLDLARTMIILSGFSPESDIPIQIIGLRPGEKLDEGLFEEGEEVIPTRHKKIRLAKKRPVSLDLPSYIEQFSEMDHQTETGAIYLLLKELIPTYQAGERHALAFVRQKVALKPTEKTQLRA